MNTAAPTKFSFSPGKASVKPVYVFVALWLMMFLLYLPAVNGGWVSDSIEHLQKVIHGSFLDFINAKESRGNSYQFARSIDYLLFLSNLVNILQKNYFLHYYSTQDIYRKTYIHQDHSHL